MIQGYLDESGIHDGAKICLVGGYFGGPGQWKKFGNAWKGILTEYNVPEFHAHEFYKRDGAERSGVYRGWSDTKADSFLNKLVAVIIGSEKIHPVSAALVVDCFN